MKRTLALVLALSLVISLAACGGSKAGTAPADSSAAPAASSSAPDASSEAAPAEKKLDYPKETVTITVPYSAGGFADIVTRSVADALSGMIGVDVAVQNIAGDGGIVGSAALAAAEGDGYSLLMGSVGPLTIFPYVFDIDYTYEDFKPVAQMTDLPVGLAVNSNDEIKTMEDWVEYCKANPGAMQVGNVGAGSIQQIAATYLANTQGLDVVHVTYDGSNPAVADLLYQNISCICVDVNGLSPFYDSGDFTVLGVFADERVESMPDVPTMKEMGYGDDMVFGINYGLVAPASTDDAIIEYLDEQIAAAMQSDAVLHTIEQASLIPAYTDHETYAARIKSGCEQTEQVLYDLGLGE